MPPVVALELSLLVVEVRPPVPPVPVTEPPVVLVAVVALELAVLSLLVLAELDVEDELVVELVLPACVTLVTPIVVVAPVVLLVVVGQVLGSQADAAGLGSPLLQATRTPPRSNFSRMSRSLKLTHHWRVRLQGCQGAFYCCGGGKQRKKLPTRCKLRARPNCSR